jgi:hypothetical protein
MKTKNILFGLCIFIASCVPEEEKKETTEYSSLKLLPEQDTLFLSANGESKQFSLEGTLLNTSEETMKNTGLITDAKYTVMQQDTVVQSVNPSDADWISSRPSVATVANGRVTAVNPGFTNVTAQIANVSSKPLVVNVKAVDVAPGLTIHPPQSILIFENHNIVSGSVQQQARLNIAATSGFSANNVLYSSTTGDFSVDVTGLLIGSNTVTARAVHATNNNLYTDRAKVVIYYIPNTPQANTIVGPWLGTTLGLNFNFAISNSFIPTRYDITGKIDIQFDGVGWVRDIDLIGLINNNGSIDVNLSKSFPGGSVSGKLNGHFADTGKGSGEYSAQVVKSGWPKISFNEKWTAVKVVP